MGIVLHIADLLRIVHPIPLAGGIAGGVGQRNGAERRPEGGGYACGNRAGGGVLIVGLGEGLGQNELGTIIADLGVAGGESDRISEALASGSICLQGDLGSVDLIGLGIADHSRAGGVLALVPFHSAGIAAA